MLRGSVFAAFGWILPVLRLFAILELENDQARG